MEWNIKGKCAMNGQTKYVLDTCAATFIINEDKRMLPVLQIIEDKEKYVSIITRMELYAERNITADKLEGVDDFLADTTVIHLNDAVEKIAIDIRGRGEPKIKLPDCIVAATAIVLGATLFTDDKKLKKLIWPGYSVQAI
jgi:predicted nucleic acid-binding protein